MEPEQSQKNNSKIQTAGSYISHKVTQNLQDVRVSSYLSV